MADHEFEHPTVSVEPDGSGTRAVESEQKLGISMLMKIALAVLVISSLIISITCLMENNQNKKQIQENEAVISEYQEKVQKLKDLIDAEADDEYIAEAARDLFDMYFPDEDVYYNDVND